MKTTSIYQICFIIFLMKVIYVQMCHQVLEFPYFRLHLSYNIIKRNFIYRFSPGFSSIQTSVSQSLISHVNFYPRTYSGSRSFIRIFMQSNWSSQKSYEWIFNFTYYNFKKNKKGKFKKCTHNYVLNFNWFLVSTNDWRTCHNETNLNCSSCEYQG